MGGGSWNWSGEVVTWAEVVLFMFAVLAGSVCGVWAAVLVESVRWRVPVAAVVAVVVALFVMGAAAGWGVS
jgi:hypothetical protein